MTNKENKLHELTELNKAAKTNETVNVTAGETKNLQFTNTNRWDTRQLVVLALMCAISALLSFVEFPLLPGTPWLKYDASAMPALVSAFAYGPVAGVAVGIIGSIIHAIILGDWVGGLMNIIIVVCFVVPAGLIYKNMHTWKGAILALVVGGIASILGALAANLVITPIYFGMPREAVIAMILPVLLPFNALKAILNSVLTIIVYKSISNLITPKKKQVKGR